MDYIKVLGNGNKIVSSTIPVKPVSQTTSRFTMRFVFGGSELCTVGRRQLSIHNDSFIVLNKDTRFTSDFGALTPESMFSIEFGEDFLADFNHENLLIGNGGDISSLQPELIETIYPFKMEMKHAVGKLKE